jgi:hypothetical protein
LQETTRRRLATQVAGAPAMAQNDGATTRAFLELHKAWMVRSGEPLGLFGTNSSWWFWWKPTSFIHETCQNVCTPSLSNYVKLISAERTPCSQEGWEHQGQSSSKAYHRFIWFNWHPSKGTPQW